MLLLQIIVLIASIMLLELIKHARLENGISAISASTYHPSHAMRLEKVCWPSSSHCPADKSQSAF